MQNDIDIIMQHKFIFIRSFSSNNVIIPILEFFTILFS